jgi:hypothetical protein
MICIWIFIYNRYLYFSPCLKYHIFYHFYGPRNVGRVHVNLTELSSSYTKVEKTKNTITFRLYMKQILFPYHSLESTAKCLDPHRLISQRSLIRNIILTVEENRVCEFSNCLVVRMWRNHIEFLKSYYNILVQEYHSRKNIGYEISGLALMYFDTELALKQVPVWWGSNDVDVHRFHRSNLLSKNNVYYRRIFRDDKEDASQIYNDNGIWKLAVKEDRSNRFNIVQFFPPSM